MHKSIEGKGRRLMESAGWNDKRRIDVSALVEEMKSVGFDVSNTAVRFLRMFWPVRVEHPPSITIDDREIFCWTDFDPKRVCTERDAQVAKLCAKLTGTSLSPIGTDGFHLTIYISPAEEFFAGVDASVFFYAKTTTDFFTNLADGTRPVLIGEWSLE